MKIIFTFLLISCGLSSVAQQRCYLDADFDGFGDPANFKPATTTGGCPLFYVSNSDDCDDNDASIHTYVWYRDLDNDGYGDGTSIESCTQPPGYTDRILPPIIDCNDHDPNDFPLIWYIDRDHDGYAADMDIYVVSCTPPLNTLYSLSQSQLKGLDCNDNDPNEFPRLYYADSDNDGYPSGAPPFESCFTLSAPFFVASALISLDIDCDDQDALAGPGPLWYKDQDNDGYTDGGSVRACVQPAGYISSPRMSSLPGLFEIDCNDNDPVQHPNQTWILDNDGDHYGQGIFVGGNPTLSCTRPQGKWFAPSELLSQDDCNDGDPNITNTVIWCLDADNDGYYTGDPVTQCASPGQGYVIKIAQEPGDCNDNDETINPKTIWYIDADNDGYHATGIAYAPSCTPPSPNFNSKSTKGPDCNDHDPTINSGTVWYLDADNDGYRDGFYLASISCTSPGPNFKNFTKGVDCDDANSLVNPETIWVLDKDGDNYYSDQLIGCLSIAGYKIKGSELPGDCNDDDPAINPMTIWYKDADGDGYNNSFFITQPSCTPPGPGYINTTKGPDCDDIDPTLNPETIWYRDADGDGYHNASIITQPSCTPPGPGYSRTTKGADCDDNNHALPATYWYMDADGDGYYNELFASISAPSCTPPGPGYTATTKGPDCNDADATIHAPVQYYVDGDKDGYGSATTAMLCSSVAPVGYSANNTDCNDNDATVHASVQYYIDSDKDGFGSTATAMLCSSTAPVGYSSNNTDCNDADPIVHAKQTYYQDADGDGYGNAAKTTSVCSSSPPSGYVTNTLDCNDGNPAISPIAVEVCGNRVDDNCNGLVDENVCYACLNATNLKVTSITSNTAEISWSAIANPVQWQLQYKTTNKGSKWLDVLLTGNVRAYKLSSLTSNQNYQVQIRAKCGNTWTSYSAAVSFKTTAGSETRYVLVDENTDGIGEVLKLYPNPNNGQFIIQLNAAGEADGNAKIQMIDVLGRIVHTENANLSSGKLQKTVTMPSQVTRGVYMLRIIVNDNAYQTKLIYQ